VTKLNGVTKLHYSTNCRVEDSGPSPERYAVLTVIVMPQR